MTDSPAPSVAYGNGFIRLADGILDLVYTDDSEFDRLNIIRTFVNTPKRT